MGGIFLRRPNRPRSEILNDINGEIVNTFRIARDHPDALAAEFDPCLASREIFARLLATPPESLTDIRRAARWVYLQRLSYGGKPAHLAAPGSLGPSEPAPARIDDVEKVSHICVGLVAPNPSGFQSPDGEADRGGQSHPGRG